MNHPCLTCGACCAQFRVAFHWSEADARLGGTVPFALTEKIDAHRLAMRGTWAQRPRCIALQGTLGKDARCNIYPKRPSVCHDVQPSWENGTCSVQCDKARLAHGLRPLVLDDWIGVTAITA